ncbi:DUF6779 domain-containing protein [Geodermatophilus sp. SYSU D01105]
MRGDRDDVTAGHPGRTHPVRPGPGAPSPALRTAGLAAGFVLAVVATVVVFVTDNPQVLRLAVVGAAWAFVLAALVTSRRGGGADGDPGELAAVERRAAEREAELRLAHERELERAAAARREHELRVENDLRRETEQAVRAELEALRGELARVGELRRDVAGVADMRRDIAQLAELRTGLGQLAELRAELGHLAELRADVGQLRAELTEQLSGEMLVERVLLRTQSVRTAPATAETPAPRTIDAAGWGEQAPELTAAQPAAGLQDLTGGGATRQFAAVRVESTVPDRPAPAPSVTPPPPPLDRLADRSLVEPEQAASARGSRHATPGELPEAPRERPDPWSPAGPAASAEAEPRRRRTDEAHRPGAPAEQPTEQRPVAGWERPSVPGPARPAAPSAPAGPAPDEAEPGSSRLAEILAQNGVSPSSGGRRRRRYRDDDEPDDVLSRVLGPHH